MIRSFPFSPGWTSFLNNPYCLIDPLLSLPSISSVFRPAQGSSRFFFGKNLTFSQPAQSRRFFVLQRFLLPALSHFFIFISQTYVCFFLLCHAAFLRPCPFSQITISSFFLPLLQFFICGTYLVFDVAVAFPSRLDFIVAHRLHFVLTKTSVPAGPCYFL